jgi:hypothetical protein
MLPDTHATNRATLPPPAHGGQNQPDFLVTKNLDFFQQQLAGACPVIPTDSDMRASRALEPV